MELIREGEFRSLTILHCRFINDIFSGTASFLMKCCDHPVRGSLLKGADGRNKQTMTKIQPIIGYIVLPIVAALIIISCIVPPGIVGGFFNTTDSCLYVNPYPIHEEENVTTRFVEVNRTGPDSVLIVMRPDPGTGRGTPVDLHYGWEDVSTPQHIAGLGLDIRMEPSDRLLYLSGDSVTLSGAGMYSNGTPTKRLVVIDTDPANKTGSTILYSGYI
jgi:hypothetical protein